MPSLLNETRVPSSGLLPPRNSSTESDSDKTYMGAVTETEYAGGIVTRVRLEVKLAGPPKSSKNRVPSGSNPFTSASKSRMMGTTY